MMPVYSNFRHAPAGVWLYTEPGSILKAKRHLLFFAYTDGECQSVRGRIRTVKFMKLDDGKMYVIDWNSLENAPHNFRFFDLWLIRMFPPAIFVKSVD